MDIQSDYDQHASTAWTRAVALVRSKQAELAERARNEEREEAFARIWGDLFVSANPKGR
jgi:hypothetical protein